MKTSIISWIDVLSVVQQFFDFDTGNFINTSKSEIFEKIKKEEGMFRSRMRPYYGDDLSSSNHFSTKILRTNKDLDFSFKEASIEFTNAGTQTYKITFTSATEFTVKPDYDDIVTGDTTHDTTLTDVKILSTAWTGYEFNPNDIIYLTTYYHEDALLEVVSNACAARMIEEIFTSEAPDISQNSQQLRQKVEDFFKLIMTEGAGDLLTISKNARELDYIETGYEIDELGNDITEYEDDYEE